MQKKNSRKEEGLRESLDSARGEGTGSPPWLSNSQWGMQSPRRLSAERQLWGARPHPRKSDEAGPRPARKTFPTLNTASCICHNKQTVRETSRKAWTSTFWKQIGQLPIWILGQWLGDRTSCCWIISRCLLFFLLLGVRKPSKEQEGTNNLLFRCGETGTGQVVVIAMSSRPSGEPAYIVGRMVELT